MAQKGYRQRRNKNKNTNHDVLGIVLMIISLFLLLCIIIPPIFSVVSQAVFNFILGAFGIMAYPILIGIFLLGLCMLLHRTLYMSARNVVCIILLCFFGLIILQLASTHAFLDKDFSGYISATFAAKYSAGGVIFGTIAFGLKSAITEIACYVVFSVGIVAVILVMTNVVARVRARRAAARTAPVPAVSKKVVPGFTTRADAQNVVTVEPAPGLFVGTIERRTPPAVSTETGRASEIERRDRRVVTDYSDSPVVTGEDNKERTDSKSSAVRTLYGDSEEMRKKSAEAYKRTAEENAKPKEPPKPAESAPGAVRAFENDVVEPYIRAAFDAQANTGNRPKKIVHDSHEVFFPVEKNLEFNDEGIESIDDIKRKLQEDTKKRKLSDMSSSDSFGFEPVRKEDKPDDITPQFFTPIKPQPVTPPPEPSEPIFDVDRDRTDSFSFDPPKAEPPAPAPERKAESPDDRFLRTLGDPQVSMPRFEPEPFREEIQDDIINTDIVRGTSFIPPQDVDSGDIDPDDIIVGDGSDSAPPAASKAGASERGGIIAKPAEDGIIDGSIEDIGGLKIDNGPAVDMTETHDITSDLLDGDDLSGMYVDANEEAPAAQPKPKKSRGGITPLDNQISIQSLIEQKSDESVVLAPVKRHKRYGNYAPPSIDLLKKYADNEFSEEELQRNAQTLETVISGFLKSEVVVKNIVPGPTVTRYEIECPTGAPIKQIATHSQDIEYELAAPSHIRIEAPIPNKRAVGIEVPNRNKSIVGIRDIIESQDFAKAKSPMTFAVGKDISGEVVLCDLEKVPHLLIAGQTGSGKSACLNGLIISLLFKSSPEDLRFILVDPKRVEFSAYAGMPHLLFNDIIYEPNEVLNALKWAANEMERRYALLQKYRCNQLSAFNKTPDVLAGKVDRLPHIIVIIDELADIMQSAVKRDIEDKIKVIAAKARAAGIHLIVATQRPSIDVLTGTIKTNLTSRIAFKVSGQTDSRIILDVQGAEALVGKGDMLFFPVEYSAPRRVQGSFICDEEVAAVLGYIKDNVECDFDEEAAAAVFGSEDASSGGTGDAGAQKTKGDPLIPDVLALFIKTKQASTSIVQRRFSIGYARASRIMDIMEELKYIGPVTGNSKPRDVYITRDQYREIFNRDIDDN